MKTTRSLALLVAIALSPATASAQLTAAAEGPIVYGHHHLYVTSVEAHKKFWIDTLGGKPVAVRPDIVAFPNVYVFLRQQAPTGGSKGSTVNHLGFQVPDVRAMVEKVRAAGFRVVTKEETTNPEKDGVAFTAVENTSIAFVMGPDDVKVELFEDKNVKLPIALHHVHFFVNDPIATRDWYVKTFGAKPRKRGNFDSADLPGVNLTFSPSPTPVVGTKGRAIDHIGFEIREIDGFVKQIEAAGIKPDRPVTPVAALGLKITFVTDPWGTYIELTEGLVNVK